MRCTHLLANLVVLFGLSLILSRAHAQVSYVTIYGQLAQLQCPVGVVSGPCTGLSLTTNGTTPGIPTNPMLDFSQSVVPPPAQGDVGTLIIVVGHYGQESLCFLKSCPAFFVHSWGPYPPSNVSTSVTPLYLVAGISVLILFGYLFSRKK